MFFLRHTGQKCTLAFDKNFVCEKQRYKNSATSKKNSLERYLNIEQTKRVKNCRKLTKDTERWKHIIPIDTLMYVVSKKLYIEPNEDRYTLKPDTDVFYAAILYFLVLEIFATTILVNVFMCIYFQTTRLTIL